MSLSLCRRIAAANLHLLRLPQPPPITPRLAPLRSFAAPAYAKPKPKADDPASGPRMNGDIRATTVRLVTDQGHTVVSTVEALERAKRLSLDLVEVQGHADPPVCKIMDYHKEKFKQVGKEKERAKEKGALALRNGENKEVRFRTKTELKDLKIKANTVTRLMEKGYRVKCTAQPAGKGKDNLGELLSQVLTLIQEVCVVESGPHVGALQAYVIVRHVKFAKKKSGKKISEVIEAIRNGIFSVIPDGESEPDDDEEVTQTAPADSGINDRKDGRAKENNAPLHKKSPPTNVGPIPASKPGLSSGPSVGENNRYGKPAEVNGRDNLATDQRPVLNQMRHPQQQPIRNDMDRRSQFDQTGRQQPPSSPPSQVRTPQQPIRSDMDRHGQFDPRQFTGRNNIRPAPDNAGMPNPMRAPHHSSRNEQNHYGQQDPRQRQVNPSNPVSPFLNNRSPGSPTFRDQTSGRGPIFMKSSDRAPPSQNLSSPGTTNSGDQNKYGIFSPKPGPSGNQRNTNETPGEPGQGNPKKSYGIFSSSKTA